MTDTKILIGTVAVLLTLVGYIPYLSDIIKGKTKPHIYSWFLWGLVTLIAFALQLTGKAGAGAFVTLAAALISFVIFVLGIRNGTKDITTSDKLFLALALIATSLWLLAKQPVLSVILISITEMLGFAPTVRKSWNQPYSETLPTYLINAFRHALSMFALQQYNVLTVLYPATWVLANGLFSLLLVIRRKEIGVKM